MGFPPVSWKKNPRGRVLKKKFLEWGGVGWDKSYKHRKRGQGELLRGMVITTSRTIIILVNDMTYLKMKKKIPTGDRGGVDSIKEKRKKSSRTENN